MNNLINERIEAFVKKSSIPHLELAIWYGGALYEASFGCDKQQGIDVFEIGSIGKTLTTTLLAVLVENNLVDLNDKVEKFRPDLPFAKDVTLLQLATHTSGLPGNPFKGLILNGKKAVLNFSQADYENFLSGLKKPLKAGRFIYSNLGMALLGNILADCVGTSYEDAVKKHVLAPLGMFDTHISPGAYDATRLAKGHNGSGKPVPAFHWSCMEPAGVWRSTTKDMTLFLKAHLGYAGKPWQDLLNKTTSRIFEEPKLSHSGLAWQLSNNEEVGDIAWHNGQTFGQYSVAVCAKDSDAAIVILTNKARKLWQHFFASYSIERLSIDILKSLAKAGK